MRLHTVFLSVITRRMEPIPPVATAYRHKSYSDEMSILAKVKLKVLYCCAHTLQYYSTTTSEPLVQCQMVGKVLLYYYIGHRYTTVS